jgi:hypothetical protein
LSNQKLYETKATTLLFRKMKFLFCLAYNEQGFAAGVELVFRPPGTAAD